MTIFNTAHTAWTNLQARLVNVELDPTPTLPPGTEEDLNTILGWLQGLGLFAVIAGLIAAAVMMIMTNQGHGSSENGAKAIVVVLIAGVFIASAATIGKAIV